MTVASDTVTHETAKTYCPRLAVGGNERSAGVNETPFVKELDSIEDVSSCVARES